MSRGRSLPDLLTLCKIWQFLDADRRELEAGLLAYTTRPSAECSTTVNLAYNPQSLEGKARVRRLHPDSSAVTKEWQVIKRSRSALIDPGGSLGPVLRILVIAARFDVGASELAAAVRAALENGSIQGVGKGYAESHFRLTSSAAKRFPFTEDQLTEIYGPLLDRQRKAGGLGSHPEREHIFKTGYAGPDAIDKFIDALTARSIAQPFVSHRTFVRTIERTKCLEQVVRDVTSLEPRTPLLFNIHGHTVNGLRAFAEQLVSEIERVERRRSKAPFGHRHAQPLPPRGVIFLPLGANFVPDAPSQVLGTAGVIAKLRVFARKGLTDKVVSAEPLQEEESLVAAIDDIRVAMRERGLIIVIDGLRCRSSSASRSVEVIESLMRDEQATHCVSKLLAPILRSDSYSMSYDTFLLNRVVVLSDERLDFLAEKAVYPWTPDSSSPTPSIDTAKFYALPALGMNQLDPLLKANVQADAIDVVRLIVQALVVDTPPGDATLQLLDSFVRIIRNLEPVTPDACDQRAEQVNTLLRAHADVTGADLLSTASVVGTLFTYLARIANQTDRSDRRAWLDRTWLVDSALRASCWLELLVICAISPEGVRPSSLCRLVERIADVPDREHYSLLKGIQFVLQQPVDNGGEHPAIQIVASLCAVAPSIVDLIRIESLQHENDPDEQYSVLAREFLQAHTEERELTLDYRHAEVRSAIRELALALDRGSVFLAHRLCCEICTQLSSIELRHSASTVRGEIRQWRRTLAAIYHGLASLPHREDGSTYSLDFGIRDLYVVGGNVGWWNYLLTRVWQKLLDGGPERRLTRLMGLDSLVLDLFSLFDQPALITDRSAISASHWFIVENRDRAMIGQDGSEASRPFGLNEAVKINTAITTAHSAINRGEPRRALALLQAISPDTSLREQEHPLSRLDPQAHYTLTIAAHKAFENAELASGFSSTLFSILVEDIRLVTKESIGEVLAQTPIDVPFPLEALEAQTAVLMNRLDPTQEPMSPGVGQADDHLWTAFSQATSALVRSVPSAAIDRLCELWWKRFEQRALIAETASEVVSTTTLVNNGLDPDVAECLRVLMQHEFGDLIELQSLPEVERMARVERIWLECFCAYLTTEALRAQAAIEPVLSSGSRRISSQARVAVWLALSLGGSAKGVRRARFRRHARQVVDSMTRSNWRYPRSQAQSLATEAQFAVYDPDADAESLLRARTKIAEAERLISGHNRLSRARLQALLMRAQLHRRLFEVTRQPLYERLSKFDLREITSLTSGKAPRPHWQCLVALERVRWQKMMPM